jgi:AraC-like DNA-binding protein
MEAISGKMYTTRELAARFGCSVSTVWRRVNNLFGKTRRGSARYFDQEQADVLSRLISGCGKKQPESAHTAAFYLNVLLGWGRLSRACTNNSFAIRASFPLLILKKCVACSYSF